MLLHQNLIFTGDEEGVVKVRTKLGVLLFPGVFLPLLSVLTEFFSCFNL